MTRSADLFRDLHPSEDKVKVGNDTLIGVEGYGSLTAAFSNNAGEITARLEKVAYVSDLDFNLFSFVAAHTRGAGFATDDEDLSVTLMDWRLRFWSDGCGYSNYGRRIDPNDDYILFPCRCPSPSRTACRPLSLSPWGSLC